MKILIKREEGREKEVRCGENATFLTIVEQKEQ